MKKTTLIEMSKQHKIAFLLVGVALIATALVLTLISCSASGGSGNVGTDIFAEATVTSNEAARTTDKDPSTDTTKDQIDTSGVNPSAQAEGATIAEASEAGGQTNHSSNQQSQSTGAQSSPNQPNAPSKHWVEDTQRVWVVDRAAWSETVPIYGTKELSICNVCGADITANTTSHTKAHMLAGEGGGYHSEVKQVQTGSETINHPEEGHWENQVVGGHWE